MVIMPAKMDKPICSPAMLLLPTPQVQLTVDGSWRTVGPRELLQLLMHLWVCACLFVLLCHLCYQIIIYIIILFILLFIIIVIIFTYLLMAAVYPWVVAWSQWPHVLVQLWLSALKELTEVW
jgi:hypothetical protein